MKHSDHDWPKRPETRQSWGRWRLGFGMALFLLSFQLYGISLGQSITLRVENESLIEVMKQIQKQTGHSYFFNGKELAQLEVSATIRSADLETTMEELLA